MSLVWTSVRSFIRSCYLREVVGNKSLPQHSTTIPIPAGPSIVCRPSSHLGAAVSKKKIGVARLFPIIVEKISIEALVLAV